PAAGAGSDPRARRARSPGVPVDAAGQRRDRAARGGLSVHRGRGVRPPGVSEAAFHRAPLRRRSDQLVGAEPGLLRGDAAERRLRRDRAPRGGGVHLSPAGAARRIAGDLSATPGGTMLEAVMIWNEPNNKSHWDFEIDPDWSAFAEMARLAGEAIAAEDPHLPRVLGGISPIDPLFIQNMEGQGVLEHVDAVAVHGFPLDWNHWMLDEWPDKLEEIQAVTELPVWVSEVGVSTFGAEEVQEFGLRRTAELLIGRAPRIHWYSLYDLPRAWPATTRHREAEG